MLKLLKLWVALTIIAGIGALIFVEGTGQDLIKGTLAASSGSLLVYWLCRALR